MGYGRLPRTAAMGALAVSVGFAGMLPASGAASDRAGTVGAAFAPGTPAALRAAVRAVGGAEALRGMRSFRYVATGRTWIHDEGLRPGGPAQPGASFESRVRHAAARGGDPARLRVDSVRTSLGVPRPVHEVIAGRRGFIRGVDANFSAPARKAMTSDRWAAIREEQRLLNPHLLLRRALRHPQTARNGGRHRLDGTTYRVLVLDDPVAPLRLFVDARTGRLARLRTLEHDYLRRDVRIDVRYRRWTRAGDGLRFPRVVTLRSDGERLHREVRSRSGLVANPTFRARVFRFPADLEPAPFQRRLARIGTRTAEWVMSFANLGFIKDGGQTSINPQRVAPGVFLLGGVANNSLVVRRQSGIVVFEGAVHDLRAEAVIAFIRRRFPGERITHIVTTHHHSDHSGGQRPYVALGARAVLHRAAVPFFRRVFAERDSSVLPDRLDRRDAVRARILAVPANGSRLLDDDLRPVEVFPIDTTHAVDMTIPFVHESGVAFVSDIYTPGGEPGEGAVALNDLIEAQNLDVQWIAGGHGGVISFADFQADLGVTP